MSLKQFAKAEHKNVLPAGGQRAVGQARAVRGLAACLRLHNQSNNTTLLRQAFSGRPCKRNQSDL